MTLKIPATFMRGGTSKGLFFCLGDLPLVAQQPGPARDKLLLRVIGSPDSYGKQIDGMGGATSSTSKTVIVSKSAMPGHDIDYLFGQVAIDKPFVDWSGNCGNLTAAVGAFAIHQGLIEVPEQGMVEVRIWQANIQKTLVVHVPVNEGQVQEEGDFLLDGVAFPAAEIPVEFLAPVKGSLFPTGNLVDELHVPESLVSGGKIQVTMISAGIPTLFFRAEDLGYTGTELQDDINNNPEALKCFETLRAYGAKAMGLIDRLEDAEEQQHTPKIAFVSKPLSYQTSSGQTVAADDIDLLVRALSMGRLHHAMMGTAAVAIGAAAAVPGTLVNVAAGGGKCETICFGHPSGN